MESMNSPIQMFHLLFFEDFHIYIKFAKFPFAQKNPLSFYSTLAMQCP